MQLGQSAQLSNGLTHRRRRLAIYPRVPSALGSKSRECERLAQCLPAAPTTLELTRDLDRMRGRSPSRDSRLAIETTYRFAQPRSNPGVHAVSYHHLLKYR